MNDQIKILNAKITGTMLGVEDHGILTCYLYLDYGDHGCQSFGGYSLDRFDGPREAKTMRTGTAYGMEFVARVLRVVGVDSWEKLKGSVCRVKMTHDKVYAIGNLLSEKWFEPTVDLVEFASKEMER